GMSIDEIRGKDDADLQVILERTRHEQFNLRFKSATGDVENPGDLRDAKRTVARILTVLKERQAGIRGAQPHED
ncbi:MAG: 50S ribosomal protein L29, partial [Pirellulaceae bacterium]|nr:50S ribosomal protein L29 [Pirellulaceae bacterium]